MLEYFYSIINNVTVFFTNPSSFLSIWPLLVAFLIAFMVISYRLKGKSYYNSFEPRHVLRALFPKKVYWHKSAKTDYIIYIINNGFLFFITFSAILTPSIVTEAILHLFSYQDLYLIRTEMSWTERIILTLIIMLAWDFAATLAHYLKHKVPMLWEFHKVHHSAEVMTPITAMRRHPIDSLFSGLVIAVTMGVVTALWYLIIGSHYEVITIFGTVAGIYLWRLLGYNLRHSHIWISYGDFWNRVFISPAQHQIHHSIEAKHYDTNFGHIFSFWDALFGTLYLPKHEERVNFGIEKEDMDDMKTLRGIYFLPFVKCTTHIKNSFQKFRLIKLKIK